MRKFNRIRAVHGLPRLRVSRALSRSADDHNEDMLSGNFFDHVSSNGQSMGARVGAYRHARLLGEVLAWVEHQPGRRQAGHVVSMWMHSEGHRRAILTPGFRRVGIARRVGVLGGRRVDVFTADFASAR